MGGQSCRHLCNRRSSSRSRRDNLARNVRHAVGLGLRAVLGDVANLAASVAGLGSLAVEWAAVGSSAVAGDVAELAASVALHSLSLAIARVVVGSTALVAGSSARNSATEVATESSSATEGTTTSATAHRRGTALRRWCSAASTGTVTCKMARLTASVAATAGGSAQT